jgi:DNA-binding NarL/FixJ family response regulator
MPRPTVLVARSRKNAVPRLTSSEFQVEEVSYMSALTRAMIERVPSVLLLSLDLPDLGGTAGIRQLRRLSPRTRIVALSDVIDEHEELEVLRIGARGYAGPLSSEVLSKMIDRVQHGEVWAARKTIGALLDELFDGDETEELVGIPDELNRLTSRERDIVRLLASGATNKEMAQTLNVAVSTIKANLTKIFRKLGQPDRLRLALYASALRPALEAGSDRLDSS